MGQNLSVTLLKSTSPIDATQIAQAFGIKQPTINLNQTGLGRDLRFGVAIGRYKDVWLVQGNSFRGFDAINGEATEPMNALMELMPRGEFLSIGNYETAMSAWFHYRVDGKVVRLKMSEDNDIQSLNIGAPLAEEKELYKQIWMEAEDVEVYEWWVKEKTETVNFLADQVCGTLGKQVCKRLLGASLDDIDLKTVQFDVYVDAEDWRSYDRRQGYTGEVPRNSYFNNRMLDSTDLERFFSEKIRPRAEQLGYTWNADEAYFIRAFGTHEQIIRLWNPAAKGTVYTVLQVSLQVVSPAYEAWKAQSNAYPLPEVPIRRNILSRTALQIERTIKIENPRSYQISDAEILHFLEASLKESYFPFFEHCKDFRRLIPYLEPYILTSFLEAFEKTGLAEQLFAQEFQQQKQGLQSFSFSDKKRLTVTFLNQHLAVENSIEAAVQRLEKGALALWKTHFPNQPLNLNRSVPKGHFETQNRPYDLSQQDAIFIKNPKQKKTDAEEVHEAPKGLLSRFFGVFSRKKEKEKGKEPSFFRAVQTAGAYVSITKALTKNDQISGAEAFLEKKVGHYPEYKLPEYQFYIISMVGRANKARALELFERNTFQELDIQKHVEEIALNLRWMFEYDGALHGGKHIIPYFERLFGMLQRAELTQGTQDMYLRESNRLFRDAQTHAKQTKMVQIHGTIWKAIDETRLALLNITAAPIFLKMRKQWQGDGTQFLKDLENLLSDFDTHQFKTSYYRIVFEQFPTLLGLDLEKISDDYLYTNFHRPLSTLDHIEKRVFHKRKHRLEQSFVQQMKAANTLKAQIKTHEDVVALLLRA